ncbi:MAG: hypothetical protein JOY58_03400 [Solirubrobacterales bacterium]|nr:hypothetical protein [Solirubrobacterales bacterium]
MAAVYLTAAFTGLRRGGCLRFARTMSNFEGSTICVRASYAANQLSAPKSGKVRQRTSLPARLNDRVGLMGREPATYSGRDSGVCGC